MANEIQALQGKDISADVAKVNGKESGDMQSLSGKDYGPFPFSASGGTMTTIGSDTIHTFTSSGTFTVSGSRADMTADFLVIAGGASGSSYGGGGAGGCGGGG